MLAHSSFHSINCLLVVTDLSSTKPQRLRFGVSSSLLHSRKCYFLKKKYSWGSSFELCLILLLIYVADLFVESVKNVASETSRGSHGLKLQLDSTWWRGWRDAKWVWFGAQKPSLAWWFCLRCLVQLCIQSSNTKKKTQIIIWIHNTIFL